MLFTPSITRKRGVNQKLQINPFPCVESDKKCKGIFTGISVEVFGNDDIQALYDNGFYGKGSQSRSTPQTVHNACVENEISESLSLGLEEAFFLAFYIKVLKVSDCEGNEISHKKFIQGCLSVNEFFIETLASYLYLKSKGWVIKSGLKFGGNYLIYRKGPRFYHASFVVIVTSPTDTNHLDSRNLKGLQRIAETSDKDVLILEVHTPKNFQNMTIDTLSSLEVSEMIIRRFNYTSFVQNQNITK